MPRIRKNATSKNISGLHAHPLVEITKAVEKDTGEDVYLVQENVKHQFSSQVSPVYGTKEYYYKGVLLKDTQIQFVHKEGKPIPCCKTSNCGYTLIGKARQLFSASRALVTKGEESDDQDYVYATDYTELFYVGDSEEHTIFLRIYDNLNGNDNDRWVVLYID